MKREKDDKGLRKRLTYRYRIELVNETRLQRIVSIRATKRRMACYIAAGLTVLGLIFAILLSLSPAKSILPGYADKEALTEATVRIDSLSREATARELYVRNIYALLNDEIADDPQEVPDSLPDIIPIDSIITASEIERDFLKQYEHEQRINAVILSPIAAQGILFVNPMPRAEAREPEDGEDARRVTFDLLRMQPVSSAYRGTVLDVYNTLGQGFTVLVLHPNGFLSRYSGLTDVFVGRGEDVKAGQSIGQIDRERAEKSGGRPSFELWHNNSAINPREYIPF